LHEDSLILSDIRPDGLSPDSSQAIIATEEEGVHIVNVPQNKNDQLIKIFVNIEFDWEMKIIWFSQYLVLSRTKDEDDFTLFRSKSGYKVCMIPGKCEFVHSNLCKRNKQGYVTGILNSLTNELFSPTLASLI
jgi:hypothetical protein